MTPDVARALAVLDPGQFEFQGKVIGPYGGAHRALLRSLIKPMMVDGVQQELPHVPYDILSWMMLYVMSAEPGALIAMAYDEKLTYVDFTKTVMEWANQFPATANIEALKIATAVLTSVNAASVTAKSDAEKKTETSQTTPLEPTPGG